MRTLIMIPFVLLMIYVGFICFPILLIVFGIKWYLEDKKAVKVKAYRSRGIMPLPEEYRTKRS